MMPASREKLHRAVYIAASILSVYGAFALVALFLYRVKINGLTGELYPELASLGLWDMAALAAPADASSLLGLLGCLGLSIGLSFPLRRGRVVIPGVLLIFVIAYLLMGAEFFRIYETTFQTEFVGREHFSDLRDIARSSAAEFSLWLYVLFAAGTGIIISLMYWLFRWQRRSRSHLQAPSPLRLVVPCIAPVLVIASILALLVSGDDTRYERQATQLANPPSKKHIGILRELSQNPVAALWSSSAPARHPLNAAVASPAVDAFSFRFNTDSLEDSYRHTRSSVIPRGKRYNIIVYFFESFPARYLPMKIGGTYITPTWHRLAENSLSLTNHYANYPLSANALFSVLTGAYDMSSKDMAITKYPAIPLKTLPEYLKEEGYRTALIHTGGLGYAGQDRFLRDRSIDRIIEYRHLRNRPPYNRQVGWGIDERSMIAPAKEFIAGDRSRPFMLVMLPVNPHHPYASPDDAVKLAGDSDGADFRTRNWNNYVNSLHYADDSLGKLIAELEKEGLMKDTLLFLFADHGEAFYQHRQNYNHPLFLYEENVHVPFLIYSRELFRKPVTWDRVTRHIDILPTILDCIGIAAAPEVEGLSILASRREQLAILHTSWKDDWMGVRDGKWKYLVRLKDRNEELYDLSRDPEEQRNIAGERTSEVNRYRDITQKAYRYKQRYFTEILKRR